MPEKFKLKVLIIDDEGVVRDFLLNFFEFHGIKAKAIEDGVKAVELAASEKFDLVFLDLRMPKMNGAETLKKLKEVSPGSKYIMMTGYSLDDLLKSVEGEKIEAFITKPFDINEILLILKDYIRQRSSANMSNILVIVSKDDVSDFFHTLLKHYNVTAARTTVEALDYIKRKDFDCIFLDMEFACCSEDLYIQIRKIRPHIKIISFSGNLSDPRVEISQ